MRSAGALFRSVFPDWHSDLHLLSPKATSWSSSSPPVGPTPAHPSGGRPFRRDRPLPGVNISACETDRSWNAGQARRPRLPPATGLIRPALKVVRVDWAPALRSPHLMAEGILDHEPARFCEQALTLGPMLNGDRDRLHVVLRDWTWRPSARQRSAKFAIIGVDLRRLLRHCLIPRHCSSPRLWLRSRWHRVMVQFLDNENTVATM